jgi:hypothetical protein
MDSWFQFVYCLEIVFLSLNIDQWPQMILFYSLTRRPTNQILDNIYAATFSSLVWSISACQKYEEVLEEMAA